MTNETTKIRTIFGQEAKYLWFIASVIVGVMSPLFLMKANLELHSQLILMNKDGIIANEKNDKARAEANQKINEAQEASIQNLNQSVAVLKAITKYQDEQRP